MSANPKSFLTEEEHLRQERKAEYRSEYLNGKAFTTAGGTCRHASIVSDFAGELRNRFRGSSCNVVTQDMRVRVSSGGLYAYPDILVVCGPPEFLDETEDTLLADQGKDVTRFFKGQGRMVQPIQRVNVDLTASMLEELDKAAQDLNVSRQAVIKTLVRQALDQHYLAQRASRPGSSLKS